MFSKKPLFLAMLLVAFALSIVNSGDAASITSLSVYAGVDRGSGAYATAYLSADEAIDYIKWYVNGTYERTSMHSHGTTSVTVSLNNLSGDIRGAKHTIKAIAWFWDEANETWTTDTDSYGVVVYKPIQDSYTDEETGAYGSAGVFAHYFNGVSFVMSASTYASNGTNKTLRVYAWFRQRQYINGAQVEERRDTKTSVKIEPGNSSSALPDSSIVDFPLGRLIRDGEEYYFDAHTHLRVTTVQAPHKENNWEADTRVQKFTEKDNP